jgi:hypothetical protein
MVFLNWLWYILWYPGIGDPSVMGRLTVLAYLGTAGACLASCFHQPLVLQPEPQYRKFWFVLAAMFFVLGLVKQFNLLSRLTAMFSQLAWNGDWYISRWPVQFVAILICLFLSILAVFLLRHGWRYSPLALIGFGFLLLLVSVRAISFHYIDLFLNWRLAGVKINWILEYSSIGCVSIAAIWTLRQRKTRPASLENKQIRGA